MTWYLDRFDLKIYPAYYATWIIHITTAEIGNKYVGKLDPQLSLNAEGNRASVVPHSHRRDRALRSSAVFPALR